MHINKPAVLFALSTGLASALPGWAQPIDFLKDSEPVSDSKLNAVNQAFDSPETVSKQRDEHKAALSQGEMKPTTLSRELDPKGSALPNELGKRLNEAQTLEGPQSQTGIAFGTVNVEIGGRSLQENASKEASSLEQSKTARPDTPLAKKPSLIVVPNGPINEPEASQVVLDLKEVGHTVKSWLAAWSTQDIAAYLSFYSADFRPSGSRSRAAWEAQRQSRLMQPRFIDILIRDIKTEVIDGSTTHVSFNQSYKSDSYADVVIKRLELRKTSEGWKIVRELEVIR